MGRPVLLGKFCPKHHERRPSSGTNPERATMATQVRQHLTASRARPRSELPKAPSRPSRTLMAPFCEAQFSHQFSKTHENSRLGKSLAGRLLIALFVARDTLKPFAACSRASSALLFHALSSYCPMGPKQTAWKSQSQNQTRHWQQPNYCSADAGTRTTLVSGDYRPKELLKHFLQGEPWTTYSCTSLSSSYSKLRLPPTAVHSSSGSESADTVNGATELLSCSPTLLLLTLPSVSD
jgi:hypothetical protein